MIMESVFKACSKCWKVLPVTLEFFAIKKQSSKDGFRAECKVCRSESRRRAYSDNHDHYCQYGRLWRNAHRTQEEIKLSLRNKIIRKVQKAKVVELPFKNKQCKVCEKWLDESSFRKWKGRSLSTCLVCENIRTKNNANTEAKVGSKSSEELKVYQDTRVDPDNKKLIQVRCTYCGKWINPRIKDVRERVRSFNITGKESRIYCHGDQCKESCPTFGQSLYPKGFKKNSSREVDSLVRQMCMERDEYACQKCGASGDGVRLHAHHIVSYKLNKMIANDIDNVITLCKSCHNETHQQDGCGYHDLSCDSWAQKKAA